MSMVLEEAGYEPYEGKHFLRNRVSKHKICSICMDQDRDLSKICVVEDISDLWALERSGSYKGRYHVLGGVLSAIDGVNPEDLNIKKLKKY